RQDTNMAQGLADRHLRLERDELGGHDAAGAVVRILEQRFDLRVEFRAQLGKKIMAFVRAHLTNDLDALIVAEAGEELGGELALDVFEDPAAASEERLVADRDRLLERQQRENLASLREAQLVEHVREVGRAQVDEMRRQAGGILFEVQANVISE